MELVKCGKDMLLNPLQVVCGIVERRHTLPVLANVLFKKTANTLALTSTDIEIQIKTQLNIVSSDDDVSTTVNAKKLLDILKSLPEGNDVALSLKDNKLAIKSGKSKFNLQTLPADDFPEMAKTGDFSHKIVLKQKSLFELLGKAHYAMAVQDIRYYLNGMLMIIEGKQLAVVATDGHRLAYANMVTDQDFGEKKEFIMPRKTVMELQRLLHDNEDEVIIELSNNQIRFTFNENGENEIELTSKLVEGKFPDYQKVIPKDYTKAVQINRQLLQQALQRVAILSNEKFKGVRCLVDSNIIKVSSTNTDQENALEELDVSYEGEALDIGFNVHYLLDILSNQKTENVILNLGDSANQSVLITVTEDEGFKYVVMPMRI